MSTVPADQQPNSAPVYRLNHQQYPENIFQFKCILSGDPLHTLLLFWAGFLSVRDAIESLRQIGDIKSHLDKKKLQKDIRDTCSKAAEPSDS